MSNTINKSNISLNILTLIKQIQFSKSNKKIFIKEKMLSKFILALALVSIIVPINVMGQTCTSNTGCTSGCCIINNQISKYNFRVLRIFFFEKILIFTLN